MDAQHILPFIFIPVVVLLILVGWYFARRAAQQRREALRDVAGQLGMEFAERADELLSEEFVCLHLFTQGHSRRVRNLLRSGRGREQTLIFDYEYVIGGGKNRSVHRQSVVVFALESATLPAFELRPENLLHKIGAALGYQDIDFPDYPEFSARYLLRGTDEPGVRELFDSTVIDAVQNVPNICIDGGGSWLAVYRARHRVEPGRLAEFLEEARALRSAFAARRHARHA